MSCRTISLYSLMSAMYCEDIHIAAIRISPNFLIFPSTLTSTLFPDMESCGKVCLLDVHQMPLTTHEHPCHNMINDIVLSQKIMCLSSRHHVVSIIDDSDYVLQVSPHCVSLWGKNWDHWPEIPSHSAKKCNLTLKWVHLPMSQR